MVNENGAKVIPEVRVAMTQDEQDAWVDEQIAELEGVKPPDSEQGE